MAAGTGTDAGAFKFHHPVKVRFSETDLQGHVFFGHYLTYFDVGLMEYLAELGFDYRRTLEIGMDIVYVESLCRYRAPAYVEEVLHVHVRVAHLGNTSLRFEFMVEEPTSKREVVEGHIVAVTVDPKTHRKTRIPEPLRRAILAFEGDGDGSDSDGEEEGPSS